MTDILKIETNSEQNKKKSVNQQNHELPKKIQLNYSDITKKYLKDIKNTLLMLDCLRNQKLYKNLYNHTSNYFKQPENNRVKQEKFT